MIDRKLLDELQEYIQNQTVHYSLAQENVLESMVDIESFIDEKRKPTLQQVLFSYIEKSGLRDPDVYNRAGIDRNHFSKIRSPQYQPKKSTVIALALALELNEDDTDDLLNAAGYSLSSSDISDLIIQFCLEKKIYNIYDVNEALEHFGQKPLTN
jgi:hypothetical protein